MKRLPKYPSGNILTFVLKEHFGQPRWIGEGEQKRLVAPLLDCFQL
jgi:hypothetical protein